MATEAKRESFGMTDKGQVVVIEKESFDDAGENKTSVFEVKHGVRTIGEYPTQFGANAVAAALVGRVQEPVRAEPEAKGKK